VLQKLLADLILTENGIMDNAKITLKQFAPEHLLHKKMPHAPRAITGSKASLTCS
jgi:hypothetical protein